MTKGNWDDKKKTKITKKIMALDIKQQFQELISKSNNILITFRKDHTGDAIASTLALAKFLKTQDKRYSIVCSNFQAPKEFNFLENINEIENKLTNLRQFVINLDLKGKKVDEFSYDVKDDKLQIYVMPEQGDFSEQDINFNNSDYKFDLIIILDTPDLESLGKIYFDQPEFFFNTVIINIDHNLNNENYGQINLVQPTMTSISEILYSLIDEKLVDEQMTTSLLTGMISKTKSFKTANVTPQTLHIASVLINAGADREKIIQNLYHTKTLDTLKLWGRVLARLQSDNALKLVWSVLPHTDFVKAGADEKNISGVVEELITNSPQAEIVCLIYEKSDGSVGGQLYTTPNYDSKYLLNNLEVKGTKNFVSFDLQGKSLQEVEVEVIREIKNKLEK